MVKKINNLKQVIIHDKDSFNTNWKVFVCQGKQALNEFKNKETRKKQIPNAFTASRLFAPFFIIPAALFDNLILTGIFTVGFALTDAADGYYARKYKATSEFGRELDPITDKIFAASLLTPLVIKNPVMLINFLLEGTIASINMHSRLNDNKPKTVILGKIKTGSLSLTMIFSYLSMVTTISPILISSLISVTSMLQLATAFKYHQNYKQTELQKKTALKQTQKNDETNDENIKEEKEKIIDIEKKTTNTDNKDLTIDQKIKLLNDLKEEFVTVSNTSENLKVYEKK